MMKHLILFFIFSVSGLCADLAQEFTNLKNATTHINDSYLTFAENNSEHIWGQLAFLELAKINILTENFNKANDYLVKITLPKISEKYFWETQINLAQNNYREAIISAQKFIMKSDDFDKIEIAYFFIAEGYFQQKMFKRALNTLESLRTSEYIKNEIPFLYYNMGNCYEFMGNFSDADNCYKKVKQVAPHSDVCSLADERIFQLQKNNSLKFEEKPEIKFEKIETLKTKLPIPTDGKIYYQIGAFGVEKNAKNMWKKMKDFKLNSIMFTKTKNGTKLFVVAVGPIENDLKLKEISDQLKQININGNRIVR